MAIFDLASQGAKYIVGSNKNGVKKGLPSDIEYIQKFSDSITYNRCTQFGDSAMEYISTSECKPSIQSTLSKFTKNTFANRYLIKAKSTIDSVSRNVGGAVSSVKEKFGQSYYCMILAPMFNILTNLLDGLINKPKMILAIISRCLDKILEIIKNLINKLFSCFEAALGQFKKRLYALKIPDFLDILKNITVWSERCEIISGPIISLVNSMVSSEHIKLLLYKLGTINDPSVTLHFESIQEVNSFMKIALNLQQGLQQKKDKILDKIFNSSTFMKANLGYQYIKAYTKYFTSAVIKHIMAPLSWLSSAYNNFLHTRSRLLGIIVNKLMGWLFPAKGYAHKYENNIVYRKRYSIVDLLVICDSINDCNDYLCGGFKSRVQEMFESLQLNRQYAWLNPLIDANNFMDNIIDGLNTAYTNAFSPTVTTKQELAKYIDIEFIKMVRSFGNTLYTVEGY